jgi:3-hydroxyacyl-CoA dehydrogenase
MGAGIATTMARSGVPTVMMDVSEERLADGMGRAQHVIASRMKIGRATEADMVNMLSKLNTSTTHSALSGCEVVVEAVTENEELKTSIYGQLAEVMAEDAILASNTSTISITRMAKAAPNAEKFVGMHFFYPVDRMQLVEVIRGEKTSDDTVATIVKLAKQARKVPIVMKDCAGFLVNRILLPYMIESVLMLLEGADMDQIDKVATKFGMPMGPIALHDLVGMDTACYAGRVMVGAYSDRMVEPSLLQAMVDSGRMGKKAGVGFRKFVGRKKSPTADPEFNKLLDEHRTNTREFTDEEIEDRLFLAMLLEAQRTLEEEIVSEPAHLEMGLILGIGFPAFRGGILKWCADSGAGTILDRVSKYTELGKRFAPTDSLLQQAKQ